MNPHDDALVERVAKFKIGDRVTKTKGSRWTGRVVGVYSTALTPEGYAVESETETGSVQIYPVAALEALTAEHEAVPVSGGVEAVLPIVSALLRITCQSLDAGGESARSLRALAVETAWHMISNHDDPRYENERRACDADQWGYVRKARIMDSAAPASPSPAESAGAGPVGVKPLKWRDFDAGSLASGVFGVEYSATPGLFMVSPSKTGSHGKVEGDLEAAKAAAQADYEARIRSALALPGAS